MKNVRAHISRSPLFKAALGALVVSSFCRRLFRCATTAGSGRTIFRPGHMGRHVDRNSQRVDDELCHHDREPICQQARSRLRFVPNVTSVGPSQINVSGIGLVNVLRPSSVGLVAFSGGEFQANEATCIFYNPAVSAYQLACNVDLTPIGKPELFRGSTLTRGYLIEDGSCYSETGQYAPLFSVIGTTYNANAPVACSGGQFAVPYANGTMYGVLDTQGAHTASRITSAGSGCTATAVGTLCGSQNQTLSTSQMPSFSVAISGGPFLVPGGSQQASAGTTTSSLAVFDGSASPTGSFTGGGLAHPILNPVLFGQSYIKY